MPMIGIDLGTTNSLAAYWGDNGATLIPNALGSNLTPSVVSLNDKGEILVGDIAKERMITHPEITASCFKRYMGTDKKYKMGKYTFSPEELSSFVLRSLKADAEAMLGQEVKEAIISVPAYFNDKQRKATMRAGELAGIKVERLISEPTAAAIAYGLHQKKSETKFAVFDLGGGTFDVSILEMFEDIMEVRSIAGDNYLGGEDFTNSLIAYFIESEKIDINGLNLKEKSAIYKQAEICKRVIGENNIGSMTFDYKGNIIEREISKREYEHIANPLLLRLRLPMERAMRDANLRPDDIDAVILMGGSSRMPIVKSVVGKMFGKLPYCNINPDETIALGAAIQVALKVRNEVLKEIILTDVCPYTLGTDVVERLSNGYYNSGCFLPIIERNTPIPVSKREILQTLRDFQEYIEIGIYQGENHRVEHNVLLGNLKIKIPKNQAGQEKVDVRFTYDINGILEVEVTTLSTGEINRVIIEQSKGALTKKEIEERLRQLKDIKIHPRERIENTYLIAKAERLYEETLGDTREYIAELIQRFDAVLYSQNELEIKKAANKLKKELENLEGRFVF